MWPLIPLAGSLISGLLGSDKEDPNVTRQRQIMTNLAGQAGQVNPIASTSLVDTAQRSLNRQNRNAAYNLQEQMRQTGSTSPGALRRGITEIEKEGAGQMGDVISQYKAQEALNAPQRASAAASIASQLPGYTPDPKSEGLNSALAGVTGAVSSIAGQKQQDQLIDDAINRKDQYNTRYLDILEKSMGGNKPSIAGSMNPYDFLKWGNL